MKNPNGPFFARDEAVWIQTFKYLATKLRELFEVKYGPVFMYCGILQARAGLAIFPHKKCLST